MRYQKDTLFLRTLYDYRFLNDCRAKYSNGSSSKIRGHFWKAEGDLGYKIYDQGNISLVPYLGFGYFDFRTISNTSWGRVSTPYATIANIATYKAGRWSVGIDTALLMLFGGQYKQPGVTSSGAADFDFGLGCKVEIPVTYTIIPKKDRAFGVTLFLAPYYEYYNTGKTESFSMAGVEEKVKYAGGFYGGRVGIGLEF